jgi:hypothetical protein
MISIRCKKHPKYTGLKIPTVICNACWYVYHVATYITHQTQDDRLQVDRGRGYDAKAKKD